MMEALDIESTAFLRGIDAASEMFCPRCGDLDIHPRHHEADGLAPECDFMECGECGHQWGHS